MQITIKTFYRVEISDSELGLDTYSHGQGSSPYYRDENTNQWYLTETDGCIYPMVSGMRPKILEELFMEMHPFKGQAELF